MSLHSPPQSMQGRTSCVNRCCLRKVSATLQQKRSWLRNPYQKKRCSESVKIYSTNGNGSNIDTQVAGSDLLLLWLNALAGQAIRVSLEPDFAGWLSPPRLPPGHLLQFLYAPHVPYESWRNRRPVACFSAIRQFRCLNSCFFMH